MEKSHLPEVIEGSRITLRKHRPELAELMFSYVDRDRARLAGFLPWVEFTRTLEDERSYISLARAKWEIHELYDYGIFENTSGYYLGNIGVHNIAWEHERCEFGYWILGDFEGKGYVSEAVTRLEQACFQLGFHRVEIRCSSRNLRSARVPGRCGYTLEACLREDVWEEEGWRDTLIFAKLRGESANSLRVVQLDGLLGSIGSP
jgi:ribosomal-protein-serine acetyltransferase